MEKSRLGIPAVAMAALLYLVCLFAGYLPALILAGFILLFEQSKWLKKHAIKAIGLMLVFSLLYWLIRFIPECLSFINYLLQIFDETIYKSDFVNGLIKFFNWAVDGINFLEELVFIALAVLALFKISLPIPGIDLAAKKLDD